MVLTPDRVTNGRPRRAILESAARHLGVTVQRNSPVPLYHQLAQQLAAAIESGTIAKGDFLSNEIELAELWQVSRPTVRRAIQELVDDGLLVRRRGVGTQVVSAEVRRPVRLSSLYDDLVEEGRSPKTDVLTHERVAADKITAESLGIPVGTEVVHIVRRRRAIRTALAIMCNWLTVEAAGDITTDQLRSGGLYELLRAKGIRPRIARQTIGAAGADEEQSAQLGLALGAPLVTVRRVMQDDLGRTVELASHVYDALHYRLEMTIVED